MVQRTNPMGVSLHYQYADGLLTKISNDLAVTTQLSYDRDYNLEEVILPGSRGRIAYQYDDWGNNTQITTPTGNGVRRLYDLRQRVTRVIQADGLVTNIAYNNQDDVIGAADNYSSVQLDRNFFGDVIMRRQAKSEIRFQFDNEGQLTDIFNEHRENYHFDYDKDGNVVKETGFDDKQTQYDHDPAGKVIEKQTPSGTTHYTYNSGGQVTDILYPDEQIEHFDFDAMGLLRVASNADSQVTFARNLLGQLLEEKTNECQISHQYDAQGRHIHTTSSLGASIEQQYNDLGDLIQRKSMDWATEMQYDQYGRLSGKKLNNGLQEEYRYDTFSRLISQTVHRQGSQRAGHRRDYNWQAGSRLKSISDSTTGTKQFRHDVYGNLTEVLYGDGSVEYREPDLVGNLFETPTKTDRQYGKGSRLLKSDKAQYDYDAEGNLIRKTYRNGDVWQYAWLSNGMLASVLRPDGNTVEFQYDALGRRISKKFKSTTTHYVWDGNKPLHEWKEFDTKESSAEDIITWIFEQGNFAPSAKLKGTKNYTILADHLGTPVKGYDQEGSLIWQRELDSYGNVKMLQGEEGFCNYLYQGQRLVWHTTGLGIMIRNKETISVKILLG